MSEAKDRYAVRFADGTYSRGGTWRNVVPTLDGAKLWRTRGHVTLHLQQFKPAELVGMKIVTVRLVEVGEAADADESMRETFERKERDAARREAESAAWRLRAAEKELAEARKRVARSA
jgi:hypothetical protein